MGRISSGAGANQGVGPRVAEACLSAANSGIARRPGRSSAPQPDRRRACARPYSESASRRRLRAGSPQPASFCCALWGWPPVGIPRPPRRIGPPALELARLRQFALVHRHLRRLCRADWAGFMARLCHITLAIFEYQYRDSSTPPLDRSAGAKRRRSAASQSAQRRVSGGR